VIPTPRNGKGDVDYLRLLDGSPKDARHPEARRGRRRKPGQLEYANKGTIYLDEIPELPLSLQVKLLHVLQDFRFSRAGGQAMFDIDTRVIAATSRPLEEAVARGEFREDLCDRLNAVEIRVPPLRERREEIPGLAARFLAEFNTQNGRQKNLSPETIARLSEYSWPGNVRELENVIRRMVVLPDGAFEALAVRGGARRVERQPLAEVGE
jgi:Nif-specific regulatory protein